jgi:mRNA interferase MazF
MPGRFSDWLVCAITSQLRHAVANWDEEVREVDDDFESSGLKENSLIRIGKLATVEEEMLEGVLGEISSHRLAAIRSKIADCLERQVTGRENG